MSLYFLANNIHFALELLGALAFFVMAWLTVDSYYVSKDYHLILKVIGFSFVGSWQIVDAFSFHGDIINFVAFFVYLVGLFLIIISILTRTRLASVSAVILLPTFSGSVSVLQSVALVALAVIAFLSYQQEKKEYDKSIRPFWLGFLFLSISALIQTLSQSQDVYNILWYVARIFDAIGFASFAYWGWQYLRLRLRESLVLIFITMVVFMSTVVTLAFSTVLIGKIEKETRNNLITNVKVFNFSAKGLIDQSPANAKMISSDTKISKALSTGDYNVLENTLSQYLNEGSLGFVLATDASGVVVMRAHSPQEYGDSVASERSVEDALIGKTFATVESSQAERFSIRASSPVYSNGKIVGVIVAGFPLDNAMVDGIKKITGLDTTIYENENIVATTAIDEDGRSRLTGAHIDNESIKDAVLNKGDSATSRVVVKGLPFLASYMPIINGDSKVVGMFSVSKLQSDILDIANSINRLTLIVVTILLLILSYPIYVVTKRLIVDTQIQ